MSSFQPFYATSSPIGRFVNGTDSVDMPLDTATAHFLWRQPKPGTLCLIMSGTRLHCSLSVANLKRCCLGCRTLISCHDTMALQQQCDSTT